MQHMNGTGKILVVDDNNVSSLVTENLLLKQDYDVTTAASGEDALSKVETGAFDLILMDIMLPGMDGYEVCSKIKGLDPSAFIIILTALTDEDSFSKSFEAGAVDFIKKPIQPIELYVRVKNALRIRSSEQSLHEKNRELGVLAETDGLTGLYNHRFIINSLTHNINLAKRYSDPLSIIMFDIDHFKQFNDLYGHRVGDEILRVVANTFRENLRVVDIIGRYGGEEFLIILPHTDLKGSIKAAEIQRKRLEKITLNRNHIDISVSISGGVCEYKEDYDLPYFVSVADELLYKAKRNGRDRIEY